MKPIAWYDPSNGVVSTDRNSPLFTPLGQVWPLYPKGEWVGLTDREMMDAIHMDDSPMEMGRKTEAKLKEKNT
jgi:hypothetical protein